MSGTFQMLYVLEKQKLEKALDKISELEQQINDLNTQLQNIPKPVEPQLLSSMLHVSFNPSLSKLVITQLN